MPDEDHLRDVCGLGRKAGTCAFLALDRDGFQCAKGSWTEKLIRLRLSALESHAVADNCSGAPSFTQTRPEDRQ